MEKFNELKKEFVSELGHNVSLRNDKDKLNRLLRLEQDKLMLGVLSQKGMDGKALYPSDKARECFVNKTLEEQHLNMLEDFQTVKSKLFMSESKLKLLEYELKAEMLLMKKEGVAMV